MAANSPVMKEVVARAAKGVAVLGICNGFQMLTETGLLPGALMRNAGLKFICRTVGLRVATADSAFTRGFAAGDVVHFPVAHHDGNYVAVPGDLKKLQDQDRIAFTYTDNPNGSVADIAGLLSENRRVLGLMPHPERAVDAALGGTDGAAMFRAIAGLVEPA